MTGHVLILVFLLVESCQVQPIGTAVVLKRFNLRQKLRLASHTVFGLYKCQFYTREQGQINKIFAVSHSRTRRCLQPVCCLRLENHLVWKIVV